jgi:2-polyprenyl-3-methyl-5-hydroxy-6-metoxy-1,4-benzoquinol methylase
MNLAVRDSKVSHSASAAATAVCVICGAELRREVAVRVASSVLRICVSCQSWTCLPRPGNAGQAALHDTDDYFDHPYFKLRRAVAPAQKRRCQDIFRRLAVATDVAALRGERLLDIGCDTGGFLQAAREQFGIVPIGLDVAQRAVQVARQQGLEAYQSSIEAAADELTNFAVVTAIDLIEHVPDPEGFLREVRRRLRPGGSVYLETPNIRSLVYRCGRVLATITNGRPSALIERLFPAQHIQYFTPESLESLARRVGFDIVRVSLRVLPLSDIAASLAARLVIGALQACDRVLGTEILVCAVLRRPVESAPSGGRL